MIPRLVLGSPRRSVFLVALTVLTLATSMAPTLAGPAIVPTEICDNCFDDDGNTFTDRDDQPICTAPANGALAGLGDESEAKAAIKCQKAIEKASTKFAVTKLGRLSKCVNQAFACIQRKNSDTTCLPKATACDKQVGAIATDATKLRATLAKACDESQGASVSFANAVLPVTGLGYVAEEGGTPAVHPCAQSFASFTDVADCIVTRHECSIERILLAAAPRAGEMLSALGHDLATDFPCLLDPLTNSGSNGGGLGLADVATQKTAVKCQAAITRSAASFAAGGANIIHKCADEAAACVQITDASQRDACGQKAAPKCQAAVDKFRHVTLNKIFFAVETKCGPLSLVDLNSSSGLGFGATAGRCAQFMLKPDADPRVVELECVAARHFCEDEQLFERQVPRVREYADFLGIQYNNGA